MKAILPTLLLMSAVHAAEPLNSQDFFDDKLLGQAQQEISAMTFDQLNAFIEYIAYCRVVEDPATKGAPCRIAAIRSETKNAQAKAVARIARASSAELYPIWGEYNKAKGDLRRKLAARIDRYIYIFEVFQNAASARYSIIQER